MLITLTNNYHNTEARARVYPDAAGYTILTPRQIKRIGSALCGVRGGRCRCSGSVGIRGYQHDIDYFEMAQDGSDGPRYLRIHLRGY